MKKILILLLVLTLSFALLVSCKKDKDSDDDNSGVSAADVEKIVFADKTVTYDGSEKNLLATNIPDGVTVSYEGNGKINAGEYTVTAKFYYGEELLATKTAKLTIKKATIDMSGVSFSDKTVTYNGAEHSIELVGTLPHGVTVSYEGNGKTNAGTYTVTATFEHNTQNYEAISDMSATLTVEKAQLDTSAISFADKTVTYNGAAHSILLEGTLPYGVTVSYEGNGKTNAGAYTVTATFDYDAQNYDPISDMSVTLTIKKATYDMSSVSFSDKTVTYSREEYGIEIEGKLPSGVTVSYDGNGKSSVGTYTVVASFVGDAANYELIPDMTATLKIEPFLVSGLSFKNQSFVYDGKEKSIFISGTVPTDVEVIYEGNGKINVGSYEVTAKLRRVPGPYGYHDDKQGNVRARVQKRHRKL